MKRRILISPADSKLVENLSKHNIECYSALRLEGVPHMEQYHADMQVLRINDTVFVAECFYEAYGKLFSCKLNIIPVDSPAGAYPHNIALNAAFVSGRLFCKKSSLADEVKIYCEKNCIEIVDVKQGYAKCSTLILGDKGIVTADSGIAAAAEKCGIDVLKIRSGFINFEGADYGFIGGSSGLIGETVAFFGDISMHPDGEAVTAFIRQKGLNYLSLGEEILNDVGGLILLD